MIAAPLGVIPVTPGCGRDSDTGSGVNSSAGSCLEGVVFAFLAAKVVLLSARVTHARKGGTHCEGSIGRGIGGR